MQLVLLALLGLLVGTAGVSLADQGDGANVDQAVADAAIQGPAASRARQDLTGNAVMRALDGSKVKPVAIPERLRPGLTQGRGEGLALSQAVSIPAPPSSTGVTPAAAAASQGWIVVPSWKGACVYFEDNSGMCPASTTVFASGGLRTLTIGVAGNTALIRGLVPDGYVSAFAQLPGGRRVATATVSNNAYQLTLPGRQAGAAAIGLVRDDGSSVITR